MKEINGIEFRLRSDAGKTMEICLSQATFMFESIVARGMNSAYDAWNRERNFRNSTFYNTSPWNITRRCLMILRRELCSQVSTMQQVGICGLEDYTV